MGASIITTTIMRVFGGFGLILSSEAISTVRETEAKLVTKAGLSCYTCEATYNTARNQLMDGGDENCLENPEATELVECDSNAVACRTELEVDWYTTGDQGYTIKRGCVNDDDEVTNPDECDEGFNERIKYKDCYDDCTESGCNTGLDVQEKFEDGGQEVCEVCFYLEKNDGGVLGNKNCQDPDKLPETKDEGKCPRWASVGCYTGTAQHEVDGKWLHEVSRGCSSFITDGLVEYEAETEDFEGNPYLYSITKESCSNGPNCNLAGDAPEIPDGPDGDTFACYKCSATYEGVTLLEGDPNCLNNPDKTEKVACAQERCTSELLINWYARGDQEYTVRRDCDPEPSPEDCETSLCNDNLDVAEKFENGKQDTCEVCFYRELEDGSVAGNTNCQDPDAERSTRDYFECPRWANVACYTGTAQHEFEDNWLHEVTRGCSSFYTDGLEEYEFTHEDGYTYSITKETCEGTNCNLAHDAPEIPGELPSTDGASMKILSPVLALLMYLFN